MIRIVLGIVAVLSLPLTTAAQGRAGEAQIETRLKLPDMATLVAANLEWVDRVQSAKPMQTLKRSEGVNLEAAVQARHRSVGRKILGGALGAVGGFFAGGYLGAAIEGDCNCDDPGLKGALIGAPIGAVTGAILGARFF